MKLQWIVAQNVRVSSARLRDMHNVEVKPRLELTRIAGVKPVAENIFKAK